MKSSPRILVIDDEPDMCRAIALVLERDGLVAETAESGAKGIELLQSRRFDAVLLDVMMPGMNGIEVLKRIRTLRPSLAVLMLSALDGLDSKVLAFEYEADDYVTKPFGIMELPVRVRAVLRRTRPSTHLLIDAERRQLTIGARLVHLSPMQVQVIQYLCSRPERTARTSELLQAIWRDETRAVGPRSANRVLATVSALRRKIGGPIGSVIETTADGYRLNTDLFDESIDDAATGSRSA
jgi:DNA-binding response OmpR family regulator